MRKHRDAGAERARLMEVKANGCHETLIQADRPFQLALVDIWRVLP